ncbi:N-acetylglutamate synthase [Halopolyspora algeriensis]|uniref:N-acetylglutamate synthase n=1 Tax=Halopolyspora algeriensis TaxID=1500506 RepID=A0A368VV25_9ACTN|nr:amino-acid N-acetyltransferase [Halopolyspora algeriensis]RCW43293.1 N-acetylglutamate synthase [Halopolyspora algeriensis]TQM56352.1 N-acetylglutamate synthase [Halopolyspora algeriensis]
MHDYTTGAITIRRARISDVRTIKTLVDTYAGRVLLAKDLVTLYESVQEFWVAELDEPDGGSGHDGRARIVGCGALHVLWEDLAEIRTVAVDPSARGLGIGHLVVERLIELAHGLGLQRLFVLTFETGFFARHGFRPISGTPVDPEVYTEMRRSADEGIAEFLELPYVKPNILGNTRMLLELDHPRDEG